jgi:hypothetical protein
LKKKKNIKLYSLLRDVGFQYKCGAFENVFWNAVSFEQNTALISRTSIFSSLLAIDFVNLVGVALGTANGVTLSN